MNEKGEVYRLQGVRLNDKHVEVIVRQMMRKVTIIEPGDTKFLEGDVEEKIDFMEENEFIYDKKFVEEAGDSEKFKPGMIVTLREIREENSLLKRADKALVTFRDAAAATSHPLLLGITKASLSTRSWVSAASFQETTKVLSQAAINGKSDYLQGLKENGNAGNLIPAGMGRRNFNNLFYSFSFNHCFGKPVLHNISFALASFSGKRIWLSYLLSDLSTRTIGVF